MFPGQGKTDLRERRLGLEGKDRKIASIGFERPLKVEGGLGSTLKRTRKKGGGLQTEE